MEIKNIGIIGVGSLGESLALAVLRQSEFSRLFITNRNRQRAERLQKSDTRVCIEELASILSACDIIIVALGTDVAKRLLPTLRFEKRHHVINVMAEISQHEMGQLTGNHCGVLCRLLVLPSVSARSQTLPVFPDCSTVESLFGSKNVVQAIKSEEEFLSILAATGAISSIMLLGKVTAEWLHDQGLEKTTTDAYVRDLYAEVHHVLENGFDGGVAHVATPGGLNQQFLTKLKNEGVDHVYKESLNDISARLKQQLSEE